MESNQVMKTITGAKDPTGNSLTSITHLHREIHEGNAYKIALLSSTYVNAEVVYIQMNTSTSYYIHAKQIITNITNGNITTKLYEAPSTMTTGSAALTAQNKHRGSTNVTSMDIFSDPTTVESTDGNIIDQFVVGGTSGGGPQGLAGNGSVSQEDEWLLDLDSTYVFELTISTTGAPIVSSGIVWYEESA